MIVGNRSVLAFCCIENGVEAEELVDHPFQEGLPSVGYGPGELWCLAEGRCLSRAERDRSRCAVT
jgi:hypothetical protein